MHMEDDAIFRGEPPFEAHRAKILLRDILEGSLDAVKRDNDAMPVVAGPYVADSSSGFEKRLILRLLIISSSFSRVLNVSSSLLCLKSNLRGYRTTAQPTGLQNPSYDPS
jgi:hypothetical protein